MSVTVEFVGDTPSDGQRARALKLVQALNLVVAPEIGKATFMSGRKSEALTVTLRDGRSFRISSNNDPDGAWLEVTEAE